MNQTNVLRVLSAYGIVQILAQDLGIKTGREQGQLVRSLPIQLLLLFAGAYSVTEDINLAAITTGIYYFLKYIYSSTTAPVCFEEV